MAELHGRLDERGREIMEERKRYEERIREKEGTGQRELEKLRGLM